MRKILVVDDEEILLMLTKRILSQKYEVITALTASKAIELFDKENPDLVISDVMMPEMDGYELVKILQKKSAEPVPIIFMTADDTGKSESKGFNAGASDYIRKPFKPDVLMGRVGNIIDNLDKIHGLQTQVSTDALTGLLNKTAAKMQIEEACKNGGVMLMIDLDSFKLVNDIYGHDMGDKVLIEFSKILRKAFHKKDILARTGGDEFVAYCLGERSKFLLENKTHFINGQIKLMAKRLMGADMNIPLGASLGAAYSDGSNYEALNKKADIALYHAKKGGKHILAIYGTETEMTESEPLKTILNERNEPRLAFEVDMENLKAIYRFLLRLKENFHLLKVSCTDKQKLTDSLTIKDAFCKLDSENYLVLLKSEQLDEINKKFDCEEIS